MTSMASERSWLLDPRLLKLFHECRRLIQSEFGVRLHLTEEHLEQHLADYVGRTRSAHLVRTWETLRPQIPHLEPEGTRDPPDRPARRYRGQKIADGNPGGESSTAETEADRARKKEVVYRGQVIG